ncbi:MAG: histidine--tRNA ligase [Candidatus Spechtbacterales bacterium]|nr:histidine--tRNA ligase [Candidatus Spechtbacterales bacterium]
MPKKKKRKKYQTPTGMHDILPEDQYIWQYFYRMAEDTVDFYNFERIDTPILESTKLFEKGTGAGTDIVSKEMYSLKTKGGDTLTMRPEGTPPVVRAYIQHGMKKWTSPVKLYYAGQFFRHEKPQRGRFRQLHQFGLEIIGEDDPSRDVEIIHTIYVLLDRLRLKELTVEINSIGCSSCRPKYVKELKAHYRYKLKQICADCRRRYKENPLRMLDCEEDKCYRVKSEAPHIVDFLCNECNEHFKQVLDIMDFIDVPYLLNPYMVRGLDYYTRTVFEFYYGGVEEAASQNDAPPEKEEKEEEGKDDKKDKKDKEDKEKKDEAEENKKRLAIASGGRYDGLVKALGGKDTPGVGAAIGIDRVVELLKREDKEPRESKKPRVFIVQLGEMAKKKAFKMFEEFRKANIPIREALGRDSISSQLKLANKFDADFAIIIGQKEALDNVAIIREMDTGTQETIPEEKLIKEIKKRLKKKK